LFILIRLGHATASLAFGKGQNFQIPAAEFSGAGRSLLRSLIIWHSFSKEELARFEGAKNPDESFAGFDFA
jgi:hypothetical protein